MELHLTYTDLTLRLLSTFAGAFLIGMDRGEQGRAVGLRTTLLVCMAACVSMLQVNALLDMTGKAHDSFAVMDLMRLPLGILSGMGFIGGGAILRRDHIVAGVTTAATLWYMTVIGLCFGGGQLLIGWIGIILGIVILRVLKWLELKLPRDITASLLVLFNTKEVEEKHLHDILENAHVKTHAITVCDMPEENSRQLKWQIKWNAHEGTSEIPAFVNTFHRLPGLRRVEWSPHS